MHFFNPGLVWFALGGAIPIIIHLLHRQKYKRVKWAAMEFLLAALKKTQRRLRLENLLLLLLRVLIMIILAMAIARPVLEAAPSLLSTSNVHHFIVLDNSYSMGFKKGSKTSLDLAREGADKLLDSMGTGFTENDKITVILSSAYPEVFVPYATKLKSVKDAVATVRLSHYASGIYPTFRVLDEHLTKALKTSQDRRIYFYTDLQRSGWQSLDDTEARRFGELLKKVSTTSNTKISIHDVSPTEAGRGGSDNRALVGLWIENDIVDTRSFTTFHADLHNWSGVSYASVDVRFLVDGSHVGTASTPLPADSSMPATFRYRFHEPGPHFIEAVIESDDLDLDDRRHLAVDVKSSLSAYFVDGKAVSPPDLSDADYLRMMAIGADVTIGGPATPEMFTGDDLDKHDFLVLCNVQSLSQEKVAKIEEFVRRGGGLFISMGDRVDRAAWNELLFRDGKGLLPARLGEVGGNALEIQPRTALHIKQFDGKHPAFSAFRGPGPFSLVFYQYFKLEKPNPDDVLAVLDDPENSPLFVEKAFGEGKVFVYTSTVNGEWDDQMMGKPAFFSIFMSLVPYLSARSPALKNLQLADIIQLTLPAERYSPTFVMETPSEGQVSISIQRPSPDSPWFTIFFPSAPSKETPGDGRPLTNEGLKSAGRYALLKPKSDASGQDELISYFAANLPPRATSPEEIARCEGNLEKITADEIRRRYPDFSFYLSGQGEPPPTSETSGNSSIWRYLLYLLCGFLVLETFLAWFFGRAKQ
jgi:hypothetical protein